MHILDGHDEGAHVIWAEGGHDRQLDPGRAEVTSNQRHVILRDHVQAVHGLHVQHPGIDPLVQDGKISSLTKKMEITQKTDTNRNQIKKPIENTKRNHVQQEIN